MRSLLLIVAALALMLFGSALALYTNLYTAHLPGADLASTTGSGFLVIFATFVGCKMLGDWSNRLL